MVLTAFRHGLRAKEVVDLRCSQIDFENARMHVRRVNGASHRYIPSKVTSCGHCAGFDARVRTANSRSSQSAGRHPRRLALPR
jgi:integrase